MWGSVASRQTTCLHRCDSRWLAVIAGSDSTQHRLVRRGTVPLLATNMLAHMFTHLSTPHPMHCILFSVCFSEHTSGPTLAHRAHTCRYKGQFNAHATALNDAGPRPRLLRHTICSARRSQIDPRSARPDAATSIRDLLGHTEIRSAASIRAPACLCKTLCACAWCTSCQARGRERAHQARPSVSHSCR